MLGDQQRPGVLIDISDGDFYDIQDVLDEARGHFDTDANVKGMLSAVHSSSKTYANLCEEGWHQFERLDGASYVHVTIFFRGVQYHCYSEVKQALEVPKPGSHTVTVISYVAYNANGPGRHALRWVDRT